MTQTFKVLGKYIAHKIVSNGKSPIEFPIDENYAPGSVLVTYPVKNKSDKNESILVVKTDTGSYQPIKPVIRPEVMGYISRNYTYVKGVIDKMHFEKRDTATGYKVSISKVENYPFIVSFLEDIQTRASEMFYIASLRKDLGGDFFGIVKSIEGDGPEEVIQQIVDTRFSGNLSSREKDGQKNTYCSFDFYYYVDQKTKALECSTVCHDVPIIVKGNKKANKKTPHSYLTEEMQSAYVKMQKIVLRSSITYGNAPGDSIKKIFAKLKIIETLSEAQQRIQSTYDLEEDTREPVTVEEQQQADALVGNLLKNSGGDDGSESEVEVQVVAKKPTKKVKVSLPSDDEEEAPPPKKVAKKPVKKVVAPASDDEEVEAPPPKKPTKKAKVVLPVSDDEEADPEPAPKPVKKVAKKVKVVLPVEDEEDPEPAPKRPAKKAKKAPVSDDE